MFQILGLAVLPVIVLAAFILYKDSKSPEPAGKLLGAFFMGVLSIFVVFMIVPVIGLYVDTVSGTWQSEANKAFWSAAIPEEAAKLLMLWLVLRKNRYFDEYFDGIVYSVMIGLGFACFENIMYLFMYSDSWVSTGIMRALMAVPGHYVFAVFMGYFYSMAHFGYKASWLYYILAFTVPMVLHGIYDMLLMISAVAPDWVSILMVLSCWLLCYFMHKGAIKRISKHLEADRMRKMEEYYANDDNYNNENYV